MISVLKLRKIMCVERIFGEPSKVVRDKGLCGWNVWFTYINFRKIIYKLFNKALLGIRLRWWNTARELIFFQCVFRSYFVYGNIIITWKMVLSEPVLLCTNKSIGSSFDGDSSTLMLFDECSSQNMLTIETFVFFWGLSCNNEFFENFHNNFGKELCSFLSNIICIWINVNEKVSHAA